MKILLFDTETTGLPPKASKYYKPVLPDATTWPHIVELAWDLVDLTSQKTISKSSYLIKPDNYSISKEAQKVHGISEELARKEGVALEAALEEFSATMETADRIAGHNVEFDQNMLAVSYFRINKSVKAGEVLNKEAWCTKNAGTAFCKIPSQFPKRFKWPSLSELYRHLFFCEATNLHRAAGDVELTKKCLFKLVELGYIKYE